MAARLVLKQLFASRSNLVTRSFRPVVATSSRFLSTNNSIRDCYDSSNGYPFYSARVDAFFKTVKCESDDETSKDLKKGDKKAYVTLSVLGNMHNEKAKKILETSSFDLFRYVKGYKFDYKLGDYRLQMKDAVFNLCLPQSENKFNKLEIKLMPSLATSSWFVRNSDGSLDNDGLYCTADVSMSVKDCDSDNETYQGGREERGKKDFYVTLSLKAREHKEENNVLITETHDLLEEVKEADFYQEKNGYITRSKDGVVNVSRPNKKDGWLNKLEIKFV
ncbi:hypothetical protein Tco_0424302 [Tanacetum coccineum]